jgi:hypothetical protein
MNFPTETPKNRSSLSATRRQSPALRRKAYWLGGLSAGLLLLANFGVLGEILAGGFHLLLEIAEEGMDTVLELTGLTPRIAQGITAYIGSLAALIFGFRLLRKIQNLLRSTKQWYSQFKAETRQRCGAMPSTVRRVWANLHWHKKALLILGGLALVAFMAITLYFLI